MKPVGIIDLFDERWYKWYPEYQFESLELSVSKFDVVKRGEQFGIVLATYGRGEMARIGALERGRMADRRSEIALTFSDVVAGGLPGGDFLLNLDRPRDWPVDGCQRLGKASVRLRDAIHETAQRLAEARRVADLWMPYGRVPEWQRMASRAEF